MKQSSSIVVCTIVLLALPRIVAGGDSELRAVTVCDVMANPAAFNGQLVALRARLRRSTEWSALVNTVPCGRPLKSGPLVWRPEVTTRSLRSYVEQTGHQPFSRTRRDETSLSEYSTTHRQLSPDQTIEATYVGLIRTREHYEGRQLQNGMWVPANGFGHLGAYFAEMVVKSVRDVSVVSVSDEEE
jgi:hypothetical protein